MLGLLLLAVLAAVVISVPGSPVQQKPILGLDLQGGLEVVLEARPERGEELTQEDLDRSVEIIRDRVDKTGVAEPEIRKQGSNQITASLAGVHDTARAARLIGQTAKLEFYNLQGDTVGASISPQGEVIAAPKLLPLLSSQQTLAKKGTP